MAHGIRPVDRLFSLYNLLAILAWLPFATAPLALAMIAVHVVALTLPALLRRLGDAVGRPTGMLLEVYPLLWIAAFWNELGVRHTFISTEANDQVAMALDRWLFGEHLNLTWIARMPDPVVSETMHGFYFAYYLLLIIVPALLLLSSCRVTVRELALRMSATYLLCFAIYLLFPVVGPLEIFPRFDGTYTGGAFYQLNALMRAGGDSLGTAFPSSHVAGSLTLAWIAWRRCPLPMALVCSLVAFMVVLATVYTQNHFAIDAAAGIIVAILAQQVVVPLVGGSAFTQAPERQPGSFVLFGPAPDHS
jgi:membrane-associated phospholipid phosphatase